MWKVVAPVSRRPAASGMVYKRTLPSSASHCAHSSFAIQVEAKIEDSQAEHLGQSSVSRQASKLLSC